MMNAKTRTDRSRFNVLWMVLLFLLDLFLFPCWISASKMSSTSRSSSSTRNTNDNKTKRVMSTSNDDHDNDEEDEEVDQQEDSCGLYMAISSTSTHEEQKW
jgi:hypothetical protein